MSTPIDFWFDFSSPYAYLASEKIDALAAKFGHTVKWRPMLLGIVFQKLGTAPLVQLPMKGEYSIHDFARSARYLGVPFHYPTKFPLPTQQAARAYYWLEGQDAGVAREFAHAVFRALFVADRDISDPAVVLEIAAGFVVDRDILAQAMNSPAVKARLKEETEAAIALGMFGAPYFIVDGEPFWGADRLPQIEHWLETGGF